MAKVTISRIFEISDLLATQAGKQLSDGLYYLADFAEVAVRSLRNGLTYADNFDCELKTIQIRNNVETTIKVSAKNINKRVSEIHVRRSPTEKYYCLDSFGWKYSPSGDLLIKIKFTDFSAADAAIAFPLDIAIYF